jgi:hypothetical protein
MTLKTDEKHTHTHAKFSQLVITGESAVFSIKWENSGVL